MRKPGGVADWHIIANTILILLVVIAYVLHFGEGDFGKRASDILAGPTVPMITLLYVALISYRIDRLDVTLEDRLRALEENRLLEFAKRLDPVLSSVLGPYVESAVGNVISAIERRQLTLYGMSTLQMLFRQLLSQYPGGEFCAITKASKWVWRGNEIYDCMATFISDGGTIRRIFIIEGSVSEAEKEAINRHLRIKVCVATLARDAIDHSDHWNFLVEREGRFGWSARPGMFEEHQDIIATSNPVDTANMLRTFERVWATSTQLRELLQ